MVKQNHYLPWAFLPETRNKWQFPEKKVYKSWWHDCKILQTVVNVGWLPNAQNLIMWLCASGILSLIINSLGHVCRNYEWPLSVHCIYKTACNMFSKFLRCLLVTEEKCRSIQGWPWRKYVACFKKTWLSSENGETETEEMVRRKQDRPTLSLFGRRGRAGKQASRFCFYSLGQISRLFMSVSWHGFPQTADNSVFLL